MWLPLARVSQQLDYEPYLTSALGFDAGIPGIPNTSRIVATGNSLISGYPSGVFVYRLNLDGSIDTTFARKGAALNPQGAFTSTAEGLYIQSEGKYLIAGTIEIN